jgi:hypothetical protein
MSLTQQDQVLEGGEVPGFYTWLGGAVIFSSTMYIAYREQVRTRSVITPVRTLG